MTGFTFYLGSDPHWLADSQVPLFVSRRRLARYRKLPRANHVWAMDSGGFTELSLYGRWTLTAREYATEAKRIANEIGQLQWIAPMDAMCEPWVLDHSKAWLGGTVPAHQRWTVDNYLALKELDSQLPFIPVLQGWELADYQRHVEMYDAAGVDLTKLPTVGLGSVCRRESTDAIGAIVAVLHSYGIRLHGFGVKAQGIERYGALLASADSRAWSFGGRRIKPCPVREVSSCANCRHHAMAWRADVLSRVGNPCQLALPV
jgi:hypothetical protein